MLTARWATIFIVSYPSIRTGKTFNTILHCKKTISRSFCLLVTLLYNKITSKSHISSRDRACFFISEATNFYTGKRYLVDRHPPMTTAAVHTSCRSTVLAVWFPRSMTCKTLHTILHCKITVSCSSCFLVALLYNKTTGKSHIPSRDRSLFFVSETANFWTV